MVARNNIYALCSRYDVKAWKFFIYMEMYSFGIDGKISFGFQYV